MAKTLEQRIKSEQEKREVSMITSGDSINSESYIKVTFANNRLQRCYQDRDAAVREWNKNIGDKYIRVIEHMLIASSMQDLRAYRSLRLHRLKGQFAGQFAIYLNDHMRMTFTYNKCNKTIRILKVSNHYGD